MTKKRMRLILMTAEHKMRYIAGNAHLFIETRERERIIEKKISLFVSFENMIGHEILRIYFFDDPTKEKKKLCR